MRTFSLKSDSKTEVFAELEKQILALGLRIINKDQSRPWGGFFVIDESQAETFGELFFPEFNIISSYKDRKLSPKILVVAPQARLSWQYHHRRAEVWRIVSGSVRVITSDTDEEGEVSVLSTGQTIFLKQGERHRLIGMSCWGVVSEIWQHTNEDHPSDEQDIVRVQDDYGR